ncbi:hypothetical protein ES704_01481 [subsurface metagenome]|jgi:hypothetical protein
MSENNIKPSIIKTFYDMTQNLMKVGFSQRDIVIMLQDRTKPKLPVKTVRIMLKAIIQFEKDFIEFENIIKPIDLDKINELDSELNSMKKRDKKTR